MSSEPTNAGTTPPPLGADSARPSIRLTLKPAAEGATGYVDGGWWPRSRDLAAELPPLLAALSDRLGPIERVSYHFADWNPSVRRLRIGGHMTRLGGFHSQRPHTIDVLGARLRLTLLVVPAEATGQVGDRSLAAAGQASNADSIANLLASQIMAPEVAAEQRGQAEEGAAEGQPEQDQTRNQGAHLAAASVADPHLSRASPNGSILGVSIDHGANDEVGRQLVSADGRGAVTCSEHGHSDGEDAPRAPTVRTPICTVGYSLGKWHVYKGVDIDGVETGGGDALGPAFATYEEATTYARGLATHEYREG